MVFEQVTLPEQVGLLIATFLLAIPLGRMIYYHYYLNRTFSLYELLHIQRFAISEMLLQLLLILLLVLLYKPPITLVFASIAFTTFVLGIALLIRIRSRVSEVFCTSCS